MRFIRKKMYLVLFVLVLSACTTVEQQQPEKEPLQGQEFVQENIAPTEEVQPEVVPEKQNTEPVEMAEEVVEKPEPRQELEASDPSQFELASGELQLVEFFAFW